MLYCWFLEELYGDSHSYQQLVILYEHHLSRLERKTKMKEMEAAPATEDQIKQFLMVDVKTDAFCLFLSSIDDHFSTKIARCYDSFTPLTAPIVSQAWLQEMTNLFLQLFPDIHKAFSFLHDFEAKKKLARNAHLVPFYQCMCMYSFMSTMRV